MGKKFSELLIDFRKKRGLTQVELAKASGVSQSTIAGYENAVRKPTWENVQKLCKALKVSCRAFMEDDE